MLKLRARRGTQKATGHAVALVTGVADAGMVIRPTRTF